MEKYSLRGGGDLITLGIQALSLQLLKKLISQPFSFFKWIPPRFNYFLTTRALNLYDMQWLNSAGSKTQSTGWSVLYLLLIISDFVHIRRQCFERGSRNGKHFLWHAKAYLQTVGVGGNGEAFKALQLFRFARNAKWAICYLTTLRTLGHNGQVIMTWEGDKKWIF